MTLLSQSARSSREDGASHTDILTSTPLNGIRNRTFDDLLLEAIDETLIDLVGARTKNMIFTYLECSITREDIPNQPARFSALLEEISGKAAKVIGRAAVRRLYAKLGWEFYEVHGFEAVDYIEAARARLSRESEQQRTRTLVQNFD